MVIAHLRPSPLWLVPSARTVRNTSLQGVQMSGPYNIHLQRRRGGQSFARSVALGRLGVHRGGRRHMTRVFCAAATSRSAWESGTGSSNRCSRPLRHRSRGFPDYSLCDDLLSGTGIPRRTGLQSSTAPVVITGLRRLPVDPKIPARRSPELYCAAHPAAAGLLIRVELTAPYRPWVALQKHAQFPGPGRTNGTTSSAPP